MQPKQHKSQSQVFLKARWPCQKVVAHLQKWGVTDVLEIGPGAGALTEFLVGGLLNVTAVEKDDRFAELLPQAEWFAPDKITIIHADVLNFNLDQWITDKLANGAAKIAVVGNIPYQISSGILEWVFRTEQWTTLAGVILLTQREFATRLCAAPGSKDYGSLSVFVQARAIPEKIALVERKEFKPVPNVDSTLFALVPRVDQLSGDKLKGMERLCRAAFSQRRKKLSNSLKPFFDREAVLNNELPVDFNLRPEQLSYQDFLKLAQYLETK